ncbi:hypothetical protein [uncultured Tenacibaculum sp.]|uniref:hypothetical protein n=1 Tax=uncultured Tenacibaculum sp. TaxID=174713 RepID=UPI00262963B0|nr:hypothetical protein [uncultured Tenacibaculum sp.]
MDIKKVLFCVILFLSGVYCYAQKYKITYTAFAQAEPCDPDPIRNSYDRILLENTNTNQAAVLAFAHCNDLIDDRVNFVAYVNFLPNAISERLYAENTRGDVVINEYQRVPVNFDHCDSKSTRLSKFNNTIKVDIEPYTEINPQPADNALCKITLNVDVKGFAPEVYRWQYYDVLSTAVDKWTDFPNGFQGVDTITFGLEELFGNRANLYYRKSIQFRMQRYCTGKITNQISYVMIGCSPGIDNVVEKSTNCNYSSDGGFTLNFDRDLYANETIVITLYDQNDESKLYGQEHTNTIINNGNGTYRYTWQAALDNGSYKIKFQTHNKNEGIASTDPSWNSLDFYENIVIGSPKNVSYSVTGMSDQTCFSEKDGYIDLNADGENGRTYLYQLRRNGVLQYFNGSNWTNYTGSNENTETWFGFTSGKDTRIRKLNKGKYRVKVRDSKGCFAR